MMINSSTPIPENNNNNNNGGVFSNFLKLRWRSSKDPKLHLRKTLPNTVDEIERDWVRHSALKMAFEGDFKAPIKRLLQAGGSEVLDIGCGAGFWTTDMSIKFPISYFIGIDADKNVLPSNVSQKNVIYQRVDLLDLPLPYEDATFDYIFIRSMIDVLPDKVWEDILTDLVRILKKGAYIECIEAYDNLFDAGPAMNTLTQLLNLSLQECPLPSSPTTATPLTGHSRSVNPWPNRIANIHQLMGMQIYHQHTPVGIYGGVIGTLLLEYWERTVRIYRKEWVSNKWIVEDELNKIVDRLKDEVNEYNTHMSWYSVVAQKKGYTGPIIQFDDVDDYDGIHTTIC
ncbi:S-adenosyl-L-methionine-dependent methyltransferase [Pilobolus umbonatus]|nr:S-adenosyl-L-methionine-dependent methyltransferase [Pilobolus umbonatus]